MTDVHYASRASSAAAWQAVCLNNINEVCKAPTAWKDKEEKPTAPSHHTRSLCTLKQLWVQLHRKHLYELYLVGRIVIGGQCMGAVA